MATKKPKAKKPGSDWMYSCCSPESMGETEETEGIQNLVFVSKEFWKKHKHLDDQHIAEKINLPDGFFETMESYFEFEGSLEEMQAVLEKEGIEYSKELDKFVNRRTKK